MKSFVAGDDKVATFNLQKLAPLSTVHSYGVLVSLVAVSNGAQYGISKSIVNLPSLDNLSHSVSVPVTMPNQQDQYTGIVTIVDELGHQTTLVDTNIIQIGIGDVFNMTVKNDVTSQRQISVVGNSSYVYRNPSATRSMFVAIEVQVACAGLTGYSDVFAYTDSVTPPAFEVGAILTNPNNVSSFTQMRGTISFIVLPNEYYMLKTAVLKSSYVAQVKKWIEWS